MYHVQVVCLQYNFSLLENKPYMNSKLSSSQQSGDVRHAHAEGTLWMLCCSFSYDFLLY